MSRSRSAAAAPRLRQASARQGLHESAPVFAALGDETRLQIVARLCAEGPLSITRLSEGAGVTRQAITKHLNALSAAGLAKNVRSGREQIWELETRRLEMARRCLDRISDQWDIALDRLKALVENPRE
jgi:DNA-binding transcriptional ArsR family regulator